jgi:hypothetical protein
MRRQAWLLAAAVAAGVVVVAPFASATTTPTPPGTPTNVTATNNSNSISLSWTQLTSAPRPASFRVYEGNTVVARNTTTHVTVTNLGFWSTHTFTVTAVGPDGLESPRSAPISRQVFVSPIVPCLRNTRITGLVVSAVTWSAVALTWDPVDPPQPTQVSGAGQTILTGLNSARIGGLKAATSYTFSVARRDCSGKFVPTTITVKTASGPSARPGQPTGLTLRSRTDTSVGLSWTPATTGTRTEHYAIYDGTNLVAITPATTTSTVLNGLWRDTAHRFTVAGLSHLGSEGVHSTPVDVSTVPCDPVPPAPRNVTALAMSASSVALSWISETAPVSFTVLDAGVPVATSSVPSTMVTGLASSSAHSFQVVTNLPSGCPPTTRSAVAQVTTLAGPALRPGPVANLRVVSVGGVGTDGTVTIGWVPAPGPDPVVGYRVYEGTTVLATSTALTATVRQPGATVHTVTVTSVDSSGNESRQSQPLTINIPYAPPP